MTNALQLSFSLGSSATGELLLLYDIRRHILFDEYLGSSPPPYTERLLEIYRSYDINCSYRFDIVRSNEIRGYQRIKVVLYPQHKRFTPPSFLTKICHLIGRWLADPRPFMASVKFIGAAHECSVSVVRLNTLRNSCLVLNKHNSVKAEELDS